MINVIGYRVRDTLRTTLEKLAGRWTGDIVQDTVSIKTISSKIPLCFNAGAESSPMSDLEQCLCQMQSVVSMQEPWTPSEGPIQFAEGIFCCHKEAGIYHLSVVWPTASLEFVFGSGVMLSSMLLHYIAKRDEVSAGSIEQTILSLTEQKGPLSKLYSTLHAFAKVEIKSGDIDIVGSCANWANDLPMFNQENAAGFKDRFFRRVVVPLMKAKRLEPQEAIKVITEECEDKDWKQACTEWIEHKHGQS